MSQDSFYIADLDEIYNRHLLWLKKIPRVEPLYAVKANYDPYVLKLFRHIGIGFDCSSKNEIKRLVKMGISGDKILYANPIKQISDIKYSSKVGVRGLVFDNEFELEKLKAYHPNCECYLRIKVDALPGKFGADRLKAIDLIRKAIELNMNLIGVSFYVGFRQTTPANIIASIKNAKFLFDYAKNECNYIMSVLDIGGGFPGTWQSLEIFDEMAIKINQALDEFFPSDHYENLCKSAGKKFKIISELGTFYTSSSYTLCVNIASKRSIELNEQEKLSLENMDKICITGEKNALLSEAKNYQTTKIYNTQKKFMYFINDSAHASFKWFTLNESLPVFFRPNSGEIFPNKNDETDSTHFYLTHLGGCTCDSSDFIIKDCFMPELNIGDFLIFRNTGSYNKTGALAFNDIKLPCTIFISSKLFNSVIRQALLNNNSVKLEYLTTCPDSDDEDDYLTVKNIMDQVYSRFSREL